MAQSPHKALAFHRLKEFSDLTAEDFTFADVIYSVFRKIEKPKNVSTGWIREISDEQFYKAIEKALKEEEQWT